MPSGPFVLCRYIFMHGVYSVSKAGWYTLTKATLGVSCDLPDNRECMTVPAGAMIQPTHAISESLGVIHVKWGKQLLTMFKHDFQRNTIPSI
jgi:hypothetical protein